MITFALDLNRILIRCIYERSIPDIDNLTFTSDTIFMRAMEYHCYITHILLFPVICFMIRVMMTRSRW